MHGRFFAGHRVEAYPHADRKRFEHSKGGDDDMLRDGADPERRRFNDFAQWLMNEGED